MWQDLLLMAGNFILGAALIPTVLAKEKPSKLTSSVTSAILFSFCYAFISLDLYLSAIAVGTSATMWTILLAQKLWRNGGTDEE